MPLSTSRIHGLAFACLGLFPALAMAASTGGDATASLQELRQAYGGDHWNTIGSLLLDGRQTSDGLTGELHTAVDLRTGYYASRQRNAVFASADGYDEIGRWHQDISGLVHPYDSDEAKAVAISESWLRRFGFLRTDDTHFNPLPDAYENDRRYIRLEATPHGGRSITLWIDSATHRLDRAMWNSSFLTVTQRYSDYRDVAGLQLPFDVRTSATTNSGTQDGDEQETVERYQALPAVPAQALQRPDGTVRDVSMLHGASRAVSPMQLEGGALLIHVSINGKGPMPFILDTGGHAILTDDAAKKLGLTSTGKGVSTGSGPGSMTTAYTQVQHLTIGDADVKDLTFLVMPYPYSFYERGTREPIAGILGLEIFERFAVTFDYDKQQLILQPFDHGQAPAEGEGSPVTLRFTDDMPLVSASLDGKQGMFGVDTGNSGYTLMFPQWAEREGLATRYLKGVPVSGGGVGGSFVSRFSHARSLQLGDQHVSPALAQLTPPDAGATGNPTEAGNIGQDVLARFTVHFDYRRQRMYLQPREVASHWQYATAGLRANRSAEQRDRLKVSWVVPDSPAAAAGLKQGDEIVAVNGKPAAEISSYDLRDEVNHREEGAPLSLTLADGRILTMRLRDIAPR
ncbi:aspartyl protease family protein [Dyella sp.]|uniref:aspartyl protease family protein n=1 Tax=Dyella sp. TaxID=1869338 RepID=UPI00284526B6|nr:aspartyl protease family protein [Dyella sp.]MDR3444867.1 aspartyl protease family protein [Dyella sp.]